MDVERAMPQGGGETSVARGEGRGRARPRRGGRGGASGRRWTRAHTRPAGHAGGRRRGKATRRRRGMAPAAPGTAKTANPVGRRPKRTELGAEELGRGTAAWWRWRSCGHSWRRRRGATGGGRCQRRGGWLEEEGGEAARGSGVHGAVTVAGGEDAGSRQRRPVGQEQSSNRGGVHGEKRWPRQGQELAGTPSTEDGARGSAPLCVWRRG